MDTKTDEESWAEIEWTLKISLKEKPPESGL